MAAKEDKEKEKVRRESLSKFIYQLANTCFTFYGYGSSCSCGLGIGC